MARPEYLKYVTLEEYYTNLSVSERAGIAKKTTSLKVLELLADDRAKRVRDAVAENVVYGLSSKIDSFDLTAAYVPATILDWVLISGTAKQKKTLSTNKHIPAAYRKKLTPVAKPVKVVEKTEPSTSEVFEVVKTTEQPTIQPYLTITQQLEYYYSGNIDKLVFLASAPETDPKLIWNLVGTENNRVRLAIAKRWDVSDGVLLELARIGDDEVRVALANRYHLSPRVAVHLYDCSKPKTGECYPYKESGIYESLAKNICTPEDVLITLAHKALPLLVWRFGVVKESRKHILTAALQNPSYPGYMLAKYIRSGNHELIRIIMGNPVLTDSDRAELAAELETISTDAKDLGL